MVCHPILKDYEPSDTFCLLSGCNSGLQEVLIYVPGWVGPGWVISPFVGQDLQRVTLAGPRTLLGKALQEELVSILQGICTFVCF